MSTTGCSRAVHSVETSDQPRFDEDLPRLAAENFEIADRMCRSCRHMHALWPYIRLARASTGAEGDSSVLKSVLAGLVAEGRRSLLIAGSQDTGLLALAARAGGATDLDIVVLDRCATPLESCRRLAQAWTLPIATWQQDLMELAARDRFDIVLVHGTLHYIPSDRREDVLARLRRALRAGGRLVLLFNVSEGLAGRLASEGRSGYAEWVIEELTRLGVPLPERRDAFAERLRVHAESREHREGAFRGPEMVHELLAGAGFAVLDGFEIGLKLADPVQHFVSRMAKRRFLVVAEPRRDATSEGGDQR